MRGVNKVIIIGNLGADPDVKQFQNGGSVTTISVATSEQWNDKQTGEKREATEWHRISLYNKLGEIAAQYLRKGSSVYIEGSLRSRKYQDQNGQDRYITEIRADQMQMLGGNSGGQSVYQGNPVFNQTPQHPFGNNNANNNNMGYPQPTQGGYPQNPNTANQGFGNYQQQNQPTQPNQLNQAHYQGMGIEQNQFANGNSQPQSAAFANQSTTPNTQIPQLSSASTPKAGAVDDDIPF